MVSMPTIGQLPPMMKPTMPKQNIEPQKSKPSEGPQIEKSPPESSIGSRVDIKV